MSFKGLNFSKLANGLIFYDLKGINSRVIYMYITILVKTVYLFISQVSGERLQDHWSSGITYLMVLQSKCILYCFLTNFDAIHITINSIFYVILHHHTLFDLTPKSTEPLQLICRYLVIVGRKKKTRGTVPALVDNRQVTAYLSTVPQSN